MVVEAAQLQFGECEYAVGFYSLNVLWVEWMADSRRALEQFFSPDVARALDAVIEGVSIHNFARADILPREEVENLVRRVAQNDHVLQR